MSLFTKYPHLSAVSMFLQSKEGSYLQHQVLPDPKNAEVLFIFGIFPVSNDLKKLLKNNPLIQVVFLLETVEELLFFIEQKLDKGFNNSRIDVLWKQEGMEDERWAEEIASKYPYEKVLFLQNGLEEDRFEYLSKTFLRKIVLETSVHKELIHYPKLCRNLFANVQKISKAFDVGLWKDAFIGVPAVVCGAGPSLSTQRQNLHQIEDRALIFAGGSTITALDQMGIIPHIAFAIDPNNEEYDRLRHSHCFTAPLIYGNRVQKDIFRFFTGFSGYIRTETGGLFEVFLDDKLGIKDYGILKHLSEEALSVTTIALMTAIYFGCDPIYFAGVDLSLKKEARYSGNILSSWENALQKDEMQLVKWMMERDVIDQVATFFSEKSFYDATGNGLTFKKVRAKPFDVKNFPLTKDLVAEVENLCLKTKFAITPYQIQKEMQAMKASIDDLCGLIRSFQMGEIVYTLFIYEIENNQSYKLFFQGMVYALMATLEKKVKSQDSLIKDIFTKVLKEAMSLSSLI